MDDVQYKQSVSYERFAVGAIFLIFAAKAIFFALQIRERVFPDEASWFGIVQVFSRSLLLPVDSLESYSFGLITHIPTLYFYLMGKILTLNILPMSDLLFLRLVNVFFALLTVLYGWLLAKLLRCGVASRLLFLVMLTNTMMLTFMAGAVSYDNLSTLLAVMSLYYLFVFLKKREGTALLLFGIFILAGTLTKNVLLPYAAGLFLVLAAHEFLHFRRKSIFLLPSFGSGWQKSMLFLLLFVLLICNVKLYGGNKLTYGVLIPDMGQVLPVEKCLKYRLFARNYVVRQFKAGKLTLIEAQRLALQIREPGDRGFAWTMIENARKEKSDIKKDRMGRLAYSVEWVQYMASRTYGLAAHLMLHKSDPQLYPYYVIGLFSLCLFFAKLLMKQFALSGVGGLAFASSFYLAILFELINYKIYHRTGFVGLALTGRYLFPVAVPLYLCAAEALMDRMPRWWQWGGGAVIGGFFVYSEFPWFIRLAGGEWFY